MNKVYIDQFSSNDSGMLWSRDVNSLRSLLIEFKLTRNKFRRFWTWFVTNKRDFGKYTSMAGSVESACVVQVNNMNHIQHMIDINASNLDGLRTQCTTSSDLIQQEIRDQEVRALILLLLRPSLLHRRRENICIHSNCNLWLGFIAMVASVFCDNMSVNLSWPTVY